MRNVRARATAAVLDEIGQNSTPAIVIEFELNDGTGHMRRYTGWLTESAIEYSIKAVRNCGFVGNDIERLDGVSGDEAKRLLPSEVMLVLEDEQGNDGKMYERVQFVNRVGGSLLEKKHGLTGANKAQTIARMRAAMAKEQGPAAPRNQPPVEDDFDPSEFENDRPPF